MCRKLVSVPLAALSVDSFDAANESEKCVSVCEPLTKTAFMVLVVLTCVICTIHISCPTVFMSLDFSLCLFRNGNA